MTPDTLAAHQSALHAVAMLERQFAFAETDGEQDALADAYLIAHRRLVAARAALNKGAA